MKITRRSSFATILAVFSGMAGCFGDLDEGTDDPEATETRDGTDAARSRDSSETAPDTEETPEPTETVREPPGPLIANETDEQQAVELATEHTEQDFQFEETFTLEPDESFTVDEAISDPGEYVVEVTANGMHRSEKHLFRWDIGLQINIKEDTILFGTLEAMYEG